MHDENPQQQQQPVTTGRADCPQTETWNWDAYHQQLVDATRQVPSLMRSTWSSRANAVDWTTLAHFPFPISWFLFDDNGRSHHIPITALPGSYPHRKLTNVAVREGIVTRIFRSCLLGALVTLDAAKRTRFLGTPFTEQDHPHACYLHWQELPATLPTNDDRHLLSIRSAMQRSLSHLARATRATAPVCAASPTPTEAVVAPLPLTLQERSAFPDLIVLDCTGWTDHLQERIAPLTELIRIINLDRRLYRSEAPCSLVFLTNADPLKRMVIGTNHANATPLLCIDAPSTPEELRTFTLAWNQLCGGSGSLKDALIRAQKDTDATLGVLSDLGMGNPLKACATERDEVLNLQTNQSTFDIFCAAHALARDGRRPATIAQFCAGLHERLANDAWANALRAIRAHVLAYGLLSPIDAALLENVAILFDANVDVSLHEASAPGKDVLASLSAACAAAAKDDQSVVAKAEQFLRTLLQNPVLPSLFALREEKQSGQPVLQLTLGRLALGMMAFEEVDCAKRSATGDEETLALTLTNYAPLLVPPAWSCFIEAVFDLFEDQHEDYLGRQFLNTLYFFVLALGNQIGQADNTDIVQVLQDVTTGILPHLATTLPTQLFKYATERLRELHTSAYTDAVIQASLRHNLHLRGRVPEAWAFWVGRPLAEDASAQELYELIGPPGPEAVQEHLAYLRDLLNEPIPTCDNAAMLLRYAAS